jgi:hypothetical protein
VSAVYEHCNESELTDEVTVIIKLDAIHDVNSASINMYPNPTTGVLNLIQETITNYELGITNVEIFDVYGRKLSSHHLITSSSHHQMNVSHLASGVYFVKIFTERGVPVTKRLVVVR